MALTSPEYEFVETLRRAASAALSIEIDDVPLAYPPSVELGDLASPVCFDLARRLRQSPRELARRLAEAAAPGPGIERVEAAGGGYVNAYLDRPRYLGALIGAQKLVPADLARPKTIVEHTNINPNKAAHIGHLRNAVLGDTLVRCLRRLGVPVEVQNYIDDTGVQVADLVVGFQVLRRQSLLDVQARYSEAELRHRGERLDYVAWELYAEVTRFYEADSSRLSHRETVLHAMERGDNPTAELAAHVSRRMVAHHLRTMARINVQYDLLPRESDVLARKFWATAFERLVSSGGLVKMEDGRHRGCWVMQLSGVEEGAGEDEKVIVRSNGTVTYVGKDIAYQMWKFGLLGRDFEYLRFDWSPLPETYAIWSTCASGGSPDAPNFGRAATVYNVIDVRQSYLQRVVSQGLRALGHESEAERSVHYAYEMVALTPAAVQTLLPEHALSDEDREKPYLEMSGRRGLGVRADDLLDALLARATAEVNGRHPELCEAELAETANRIVVAALRYYMLRFSRNRVVAFDLDAALAFEGETGPYLQYSVVRARKILSKVAERYGAAACEPQSLADRASGAGSIADDLWELAQGLLRVDVILRQSVDSLELSGVAKHAYVLAQAFNSFYHRYPVLQEADEVARGLRCAVVRAYHDRMTDLLALMGIEVPDRM